MIEKINKAEKIYPTYMLDRDLLYQYSKFVLTN